MTDLSLQYTSDKEKTEFDEVSSAPQVFHGFCLCVVLDPVRQERLRWCMCGVSALSMIFAYAAVAACSFMILDYHENNKLFNPAQLGLFNMAVFDEGGHAYGCIPQNGDVRFKDGGFGAGRAFGVLTVIVETILFLLLGWILLFMRPDWSVLGWRVLQRLFILTLFLQLLTFSAFGSSVCSEIIEASFGSSQPITTECGPGAASKLAAINVILLILLIVVSCMVPAPIHPHFIRWTDDYDNGVQGGDILVPYDADHGIPDDDFSIPDEDRSYGSDRCDDYYHDENPKYSHSEDNKAASGSEDEDYVEKPRKKNGDAKKKKVREKSLD